MNQVAAPPKEVEIFKHIFIVIAALLLPGLQIGLFAWLYALIPLLVFYYLHRFGEREGGKYILIGTSLAFLTGLMAGMASVILVAMTLMPAGFSLARSAVRQEPPHLSGMKGVLVLAGTWFLVSGLIALSEGTHPYFQLERSIGQGMDEALQQYRENEEIPSDVLYVVVETFTRIKERLIQFLPAVLTSIALFSVWLTMVIGNRLLLKKTGVSPWPDYQYWQLPDKLVWSVIVAAALALTPEPGIRTIGFNLLLVVSVIYCFQGLAIVLFFLNKWQVSVLVRSLLYLILFFQSVGTLFLSILGLADVWLNLRRSQRMDDPPEEP